MAGGSEAEEIWKLVTSPGKLERDRGVALLEKILSEGIAADWTELEEDLIRRCCSFAASPSSAESMEAKLGALAVAKSIVSLCCRKNANPEFEDKMKTAAKTLLEDEEVRVRLAAGELLGAMARFLAPHSESILEEFEPTLTELIRTNLERDSAGSPDPPSSADHVDVDMVSRSMDGSRGLRRFSSKEELFHETAGWRNLETSMKALQQIVEGTACRSAGTFPVFAVSENLMELVLASVDHANRFVRETGFDTLASFAKLGGTCSASSCPTGGNFFARYCEVFCQALAKGLADNWSQVRLAATVATRQLMESLTEDCRQGSLLVEEVLFPRICLNRYYLAEGVRLYSQKTWMQCTAHLPGGGRNQVKSHVSKYVEYYVACTKADNHAVREAACQCIAELAAKIEAQALSPHVKFLLSTLIECFEDESWPVRDMACVAAGKFVLSYPDVSRSSVPRLKALFYDNLGDPIPSVRQGAAISVANLVTAYRDSDPVSSLEEELETVQTGLDRIQDQGTDCARFGNLDSTTQFGVAKRARDNDPELHENQTMYSCGSLAPKMGRSSSSGCSSCKFRRPSEPWEYVDGCVLLLTELSGLKGFSQTLLDTFPGLLSKVAGICRFRHYVSHYFLVETVNKVLPVVAKNMGVKEFKNRYLEDFLEHIFYAAESENALASTAGLDCLREMSRLVGPNIFRGRVEQFNPRYLSTLEKALSGFDPIIFGQHQAGDSRISVAVAADPYRPSMTQAVPIPSSKPSLGGTPSGSPHT